jgi:HAD superfamily hydrolase (TIGR01509 family)
MAIRAVVFDLFDTLVDLPMERLPRVALRGRVVPSTTGALHAVLAGRVELDFESFAGALAEVDRTWREAYWAEGLELPTRERFARLCARLGIEDPELPAQLTEVHMGLIEALADTPAHHAGVLDSLRARARLGLCSNFSHAPTARAILARAGLGARLDAVVISHDVGLRKPRREVFEAVLAGLGSAPEETLHVGDNLAADVAGAGALGMRTAWITRRVPDPAAARAATPEARPDWIVNDIAEIASILEKSG